MPQTETVTNARSFPGNSLTYLNVADFPDWFASLLEQLTPEELAKFLRPHRYSYQGMDIQAAILRVVDDLRRESPNQTDYLLLKKIREYVHILD
jgi:hypothetical protein